LALLINSPFVLTTKLLPLALGGLAIGTTEFVMMGLLPSISQDFRVTIPEVGYVISAYARASSLGRRYSRCWDAAWRPSAYSCS
jgi:hypothetical protein